MCPHRQTHSRKTTTHTGNAQPTQRRRLLHWCVSSQRCNLRVMPDRELLRPCSEAHGEGGVNVNAWFQPTSQANTIHMAGMLLTSSSTRPGSPLALFTGCFCQSEGLGCCTSYLGPGLLHVSTLATGLGVARASVANLSQSQISRARLSEGQYNYPTGTERHLVVPIPSSSRPACDGRIESR
ncbi:uncharacterized protein CCOS01_01021 [Colletotrichum costaricense]|uniref:Uncharacterized protein n=1 Tax=Colletotrichum costaricense TaxID=1209916 RepID=A0AAI9ZC10_9PEZI|nr:uncharacterized protein CCOS01_01021 [Colletotrichum costaricense]KAK1539707.1 hypothetical protein CCOS01_01021 [Colletotrichum costaricense]